MLKNKTTRNAVTVPVFPSRNARVIGESHCLAKNDTSCEISECRTKEQVDATLTFIPSMSSNFKVYSEIAKKKLGLQAEKQFHTKTILGEHSRAQIAHIKLFQKGRHLVLRVS